MSSRNYAVLRKRLQLTLDDVNEQQPTDIAYVHSVYAPLSIRLIQNFQSPGWRAIRWGRKERIFRCLGDKVKLLWRIRFGYNNINLTICLPDHFLPALQALVIVTRTLESVQDPHLSSLSLTSHTQYFLFNSTHFSTFYFVSYFRMSMWPLEPANSPFLPPGTSSTCCPAPRWTSARPWRRTCLSAARPPPAAAA